MATLRKDFGRRLRQIRDELRKTQEQFAEMLGISVDFLSLIERGKNAPSFEKLETMAKRLNKPVAYLFTFENGAEKRETRAGMRVPRGGRTKAR